MYEVSIPLNMCEVSIPFQLPLLDGGYEVFQWASFLYNGAWYCVVYDAVYL